MTIPARPKARLLAVLLAGPAIFAAGLLFASKRLPEWRAGALPPPSFYKTRFRELVAAAGLRPLTSEPRVHLSSTTNADDQVDLCPIYRALGSGAADWLASSGLGLYVEVMQSAASTGGIRALFKASLSVRGEAWAAEWGLESISFLLQARSKWPEPKELGEPLTRALLRPGELLGPSEDVSPITGALALYPVGGTAPAQFLAIGYEQGSREIGTFRMRQKVEQITSVSFWFRAAIHVLLALGTLALFLKLAIQKRLDMRNGAFLSLPLLLVLAAGCLAQLPDILDFLESLSRAVIAAVSFFLLWSAAESWVRSRVPGFTTSLDALRAGRLGPRGGHALLSGSAMGAGLAGVRLGAMALAASVPGLAPEQSSVSLPLFSPEGNLFWQGALPAGFVLLGIAVALHLFSARWVPVAATGLGALFLLPWTGVCPILFASLVGLTLAGILVFTYQRFGLAALLTASVVSYLLPAAVFSAKHMSWMGGSLAVTGGVTLFVILLGLVGLSRPAHVEARRLAPPAFVRRLEEERRLKYEMDLLARMQVGLLPEKPPEVRGYELAARSVLATEVGGDLYDFLEDEKGRLWIAAGDVSGHGYSCSIAQAMTKAALSSLVKSDRTPSQVLQDVDRVLRRGGSSRTFTSLALLRLDPETGEGLVSNAGHPYPLLIEDGTISEISLPSLPLGQGPIRHYEDRPVRIPLGSVLVFFSDGFIEATNANEEPYGFDRPRNVLKTLARRPAGAILEALFADWREHVGPGAPADDTTLVVLKRTLQAS